MEIIYRINRYLRIVLQLMHTQNNTPAHWILFTTIVRIITVVGTQTRIVIIRRAQYTEKVTILGKSKQRDSKTGRRTDDYEDKGNGNINRSQGIKIKGWLSYFFTSQYIIA